MKKAVVCAVIVVVFNCDGKNEVELIFSEQSSSSKIVTHSNELGEKTCCQEQRSKNLMKHSVRRINYREVSDLTIEGDQLTVTVRDFLVEEIIGEEKLCEDKQKSYRKVSVLSRTDKIRVQFFGEGDRNEGSGELNHSKGSIFELKTKNDSNVARPNQFVPKLIQNGNKEGFFRKIYEWIKNIGKVCCFSCCLREILEK